MTEAIEALEPLNFIRETFSIMHLNTRREKHGDEPAVGTDLKLVGRMSNQALDKFSRELRPSFYVADSGRPQLSGMVNTPTRILTEVESVKFLRKLENVKLTVHDDEFVERTAILPDGKIKHFLFEMMDGGTVEITFTVSYSEPDEDEITKVRHMLFQPVKISLEIVQPEAKPDHFQQAMDLGSDPATHSDARKEAERAFSGAVTSPDEIPTGLEPEPAPQ